MFCSEKILQPLRLKTFYILLMFPQRKKNRNVGWEAHLKFILGFSCLTAEIIWSEPREEASRHYTDGTLTESNKSFNWQFLFCRQVYLNVTEQSSSSSQARESQTSCWLRPPVSTSTRSTDPRPSSSHRPGLTSLVRPRTVRPALAGRTNTSPRSSSGATPSPTSSLEARRR